MGVANLGSRGRFGRLYRWHPNQGHYSLVRDDDDDVEEYNLYEYDAERLFFKRVTIVYEHNAEKNQFVRIAKSIKWQDTK